MKREFQHVRNSALALILASSLALGPTASVFASGVSEGTAAADNNSVSDTVLNYVSLGDSMTNGYGLKGYETDTVKVNGYRRYVEESYPAIFAEWLADWKSEEYESVDLSPLAISAMRAEDLNFILNVDWENADRDYIHDTFETGYSREMWMNKGYKELWKETFGDYGDYYTWDEFVNDRFKDYEGVDDGTGVPKPVGTLAVAEDFQTSVQNADIVSLGIGNANFGVFMLGRLTNAIGFDGSSEDDAWIDLEDALAVCDEATKKMALEFYNKGLEILGEKVDPQAMPIVEPIVNAMTYTLVSYVLNYKGIIDRIAELNPDVEIMLVGIMNTMAGLNLEVKYEGKTYTVPMEDVLGVLIETVNLYIAALPTVYHLAEKVDAEYKDYQGEEPVSYTYENVTFYYAEASKVEVIVNEFEDADKNNWVVNAEACIDYRTLRIRLIEEVCGMAFDLLNMGLVDITIQDVEEYETAMGSNEKLKEYVAGLNSDEAIAKAKSCAIYLAFETAVVTATMTDKISLDAFEQLVTGLNGVFDGILKDYETNVNSADKTTAYEIVAAMYNSNSSAIKSLYENANVKDAVDSIHQLIAIPEALSKALNDDAAVSGLLHLFARMLVGNGIGAHPTANGHKELAAAVIEAYANKYTAADSVTDKVMLALKELADLIEENGPAMLEDLYTYAEEEGYIAELEKAAEELKAEIEEYVETEIKPEVEAAAAKLEAKLEELEAELKKLEAELQAKYEELEGAAEELKREIEAAIEEIEAAIEEIKEAIEEVKETIASLEDKMNDLAAYAEEVTAAVEALVKAIADSAAADVQEAIDNVQAELENIGSVIGELSGVIDEINAVIDDAQEKMDAAVEALKELQAEVEAAIEEIKAEIEEAVAELKEAAAEAKAELEAILREAEAAAEELMAEAEILAGELKAELEELAGEAAVKLEEAKAELEAVYANATTAEYVVTKNSHYVAIGDNSAEAVEGSSYGKQLAENLGVEYTELVMDGMADELAGFVADNSEVIAEADLITVGLSHNEIMGYVVDQLYDTMIGGAAEELDWTAYAGEEGAEAIARVLAELKAYLTEADPETSEMLYMLIEYYAYASVTYALYYAEAINVIHEVNPDALVIVVGMYNALEELVIPSGEEEVEAGKVIGVVVDLMNLYTTAYAMLTENTIYVDAPAVATSFSGSEMNEYITEFVRNSGEGFRATEDGHEYIKDQIRAALRVYMNGDVNKDGTVNSDDAVLILQDVANVLDPVRVYDAGLADYNLDGKINSDDAVMILQFVAAGK